ncbi:restriction endonuclease subunit S [Rhodobacteraceae bacterium]|nr:restriction endonuclease subunit S [Paracoccaceae bacterium]
MSEFLNFFDAPVVSLDELVSAGDIELGRGNIISKIDIREVKGSFPIYSSSSKNNGMMGRYGNYMFDEEMVTWSVDGGGTFFYRPKHKFSVTNVSGYMRANQEKFDYRFLHGVLDYQHSFLNFDYQSKAHPSVIRELYEIPIPPLPEQKKIASILTSVDEVIETTQKQIDKLQDLKKATMNELLTKGIGHTEFKDSELGRIPKSWEIYRLGEIAHFQRGHDITAAERIKGEFPVVSSSGVSGYHNKPTTKAPGVVVGRKGSIGTVHFLESDFWAHDTSLFVKNFFSNNEKFVYYLCCWLDLQQYGTKSGAPSLNRNDIHPIKLKIPPLFEQKEISKILSDFEKTIEKKKNKLTQTQSLKKSLMQDLLTGKVRVQVN